jgi:hypothetical protein
MALEMDLPASKSLRLAPYKQQVNINNYNMVWLTISLANRRGEGGDLLLVQIVSICLCGGYTDKKKFRMEQLQSHI